MDGRAKTTTRLQCQCGGGLHVPVFCLSTKGKCRPTFLVTFRNGRVGKDGVPNHVKHQHQNHGCEYDVARMTTVHGPEDCPAYRTLTEATSRIPVSLTSMNDSTLTLNVRKESEHIKLIRGGLKNIASNPRLLLSLDRWMTGTLHGGPESPPPNNSTEASERESKAVVPRPLDMLLINNSRLSDLNRLWMSSPRPGTPNLTEPCVFCIAGLYVEPGSSIKVSTTTTSEIPSQNPKKNNDDSVDALDLRSLDLDSIDLGPVGEVAFSVLAAAFLKACERGYSMAPICCGDDLDTRAEAIGILEQQIRGADGDDQGAVPGNRVAPLPVRLQLAGIGGDHSGNGGMATIKTVIRQLADVAAAIEEAHTHSIEMDRVRKNPVRESFLSKWQPILVEGHQVSLASPSPDTSPHNPGVFPTPPPQRYTDEAMIDKLNMKHIRDAVRRMASNEERECMLVDIAEGHHYRDGANQDDDDGDDCPECEFPVTGKFHVDAYVMVAPAPHLTNGHLQDTLDKAQMAISWALWDAGEQYLDDDEDEDEDEGGGVKWTASVMEMAHRARFKEMTRSYTQAMTAAGPAILCQDKSWGNLLRFAALAKYHISALLTRFEAVEKNDSSKEGAQQQQAESSPSAKKLKKLQCISRFSEGVEFGPVSPLTYRALFGSIDPPPQRSPDVWKKEGGGNRPVVRMTSSTRAALADIDPMIPDQGYYERMIDYCGEILDDDENGGGTGSSNSGVPTSRKGSGDNNMKDVYESQPNPLRRPMANLACAVVANLLNTQMMKNIDFDSVPNEKLDENIRAQLDAVTHGANPSISKILFEPEIIQCALTAAVHLDIFSAFFLARDMGQPDAVVGFLPAGSRPPSFSFGSIRLHDRHQCAADESLVAEVKAIIKHRNAEFLMSSSENEYKQYSVNTRKYYQTYFSRLVPITEDNNDQESPSSGMCAAVSPDHLHSFLCSATYHYMPHVFINKAHVRLFDFLSLKRCEPLRKLCPGLEIILFDSESKNNIMQKRGNRKTATVTDIEILGTVCKDLYCTILSLAFSFPSPSGLSSLAPTTIHGKRMGIPIGIVIDIVTNFMLVDLEAPPWGWLSKIKVGSADNLVNTMNPHRFANMGLEAVKPEAVRPETTVGAGAAVASELDAIGHYLNFKLERGSSSQGQGGQDIQCCNAPVAVVVVAGNSDREMAGTEQEMYRSNAGSQELCDCHFEHHHRTVNGTSIIPYPPHSYTSLIPPICDRPLHAFSRSLHQRFPLIYRFLESESIETLLLPFDQRDMVHGAESSFSVSSSNGKSAAPLQKTRNSKKNGSMTSIKAMSILNRNAAIMGLSQSLLTPPPTDGGMGSTTTTTTTKHRSYQRNNLFSPIHSEDLLFSRRVTEILTRYEFHLAPGTPLPLSARAACLYSFTANGLCANGLGTHSNNNSADTPNGMGNYPLIFSNRGSFELVFDQTLFVDSSSLNAHSHPFMYANSGLMYDLAVQDRISSRGEFSSTKRKRRGRTKAIRGKDKTSPVIRDESNPHGKRTDGDGDSSMEDEPHKPAAVTVKKRKEDALVDDNNETTTIDNDQCHIQERGESPPKRHRHVSITILEDEDECVVGEDVRPPDDDDDYDDGLYY